MNCLAIYEKEIFKNPCNGYCVFQFKTRDKSVPEEARSTYTYRDRLTRFTATGYGLPQTNAIEFILTGEWREDKKHGCQLVVQEWQEVVPKTTDGVKAYLACGLIKGIGEKLAEAIVARYGVGALDILEKHPERLLEIKGITEGRLEDIKESYAESRGLRDLMTYLAPYGITPKTALKIQQEYGGSCLDIIRKQPFKLCSISGFGFKRVDAIALKAGCEPHDPLRIQGALQYILEENSSQNGHLYMETDKLCKEALILLNEKLPFPHLRLHIREVMDELYETVLQGELVSNGDAIYLSRNFNSEDQTARCIIKILAEPSPLIDISKEMAQVVAELGVSLSKKQMEGVMMTFRYNLSIITGPPGTGKTTIQKVAIEIYQRIYKNGKILLTAPTGRASRRMAESTGYPEAKTIHSALKLIGDDVVISLGNEEPLDADFIIVDEFSMTDMWLASKLFSRIKPGAKIVLVGDPDQLPSVGPGNVFRELISCEIIPVTVLDEIFRQTKDNLIPYNAKFINDNKTQLYYGRDFTFTECQNQKEAAEIIQRLYLEEIAHRGIQNVQILSPFRSEGDASAEKLNMVIRELVNPSVPDAVEFEVGTRTFRIGDRVMQTKNNYDLVWTAKDGSKGAGAFNGDIGTVVEISLHDNEMLVDMDGRLAAYKPIMAVELELAYAMTVHKAMGSEFDTVIIPVISAHTILLHRNLLYTAVTRAKRRVRLVGQRKSLFIAIHSNKIVKRNSLLGRRIIQYFQPFAAEQESKTTLTLPDSLKSTG